MEQKTQKTKPYLTQQAVRVLHPRRLQAQLHRVAKRLGAMAQLDDILADLPKGGRG